jgi:hypothetical protein
VSGTALLASTFGIQSGFATLSIAFPGSNLFYTSLYRSMSDSAMGDLATSDAYRHNSFASVD